MFHVGHDVAVQIYSCNAMSGGFAWSFVALRENLYDNSGKLIITRFGEPTWRAMGRQHVVGRRAQPVTVDPSAIPCLLLSTPSPTAGPDGDRLADTTRIQPDNHRWARARPPPTATRRPSARWPRSPYTADHIFWKQTAA